MNKKDKPGVFLRVKASTIDSIIIIVFMGLAADLFSRFDNVPDYVRILAFVFIFFLYEPLMVSIAGATFGHHMNKLKVQRDKDGKNLNIGTAILRFTIKALLGWISLFTVSTNEDHKAIHDIMAHSTVEYDMK